MDVVEITELEKIDATRVDGVGVPANGIPILLMKSVEPVEKDWAEWDAAHEGGGKGGAAAAARAKGGDSKASSADAFERAKQTIADHKAGKPVSAEDLKNAHLVHENHLKEEAKLKAEGKLPAKAAAKPKAPAKPAAKKGANDDAAEGEVDREAAKSLVRGIIAKAVGAGGEVDEEPDVKGGTEVLAQIARLIIAEAQELEAGQAGEIADILELACAAEKIWCWRTGEEAVGSGSVMPATMLMQSAAGCGCCENCTMGAAEKSGPSAEERRQAAADGNALSDGSYPIRNEHELHAAAILARSGHGDVEGAKRLIARRAKELGVDNPLEDSGDDTSKSAAEGKIAEEGKTVDTVSQDGGLTKAVEDAIAKATAPLQERIKALDAELAKVKATPIPGGPMMTAVTPRAAADGERGAREAAYYRAQADALTGDPVAANAYRQLARQAEAKAS